MKVRRWIISVSIREGLLTAVAEKLLQGPPGDQKLYAKQDCEKVFSRRTTGRWSLASHPDHPTRLARCECEALSSPRIRLRFVVDLANCVTKAGWACPAVDALSYVSSLLTVRIQGCFLIHFFKKYLRKASMWHLGRCMCWARKAYGQYNQALGMSLPQGLPSAQRACLPQERLASQRRRRWPLGICPKLTSRLSATRQFGIAYGKRSTRVEKPRPDSRHCSPSMLCGRR